MGKSRLVVLAIGTAVLVSLIAFVPAEYHATARAVAALGSITPLNLAVYGATVTIHGKEYHYGCNDLGDKFPFAVYVPYPVDHNDNSTYSAAQAVAKWSCIEGAMVVYGELTVAKECAAKLLWGLLLWFTVVSNYPIVDRDGDDDKSAGGEVLRIGIMDCCSCYKGTMGNCVWALLCPGARAAATMHSTGTMNYFLACLCMATPFASFVLCYVSLGTDMSEKLGGNIPDCCSATFQSFCCMPCKIAREAAALDAVQGRETNLCGVAIKVSNDYRQYP